VLEPDGFAQALKGVLDFSPSAATLDAHSQRAGIPADAPDLPVHKGQRRDELDERFGPPEGCSRGTQGTLKVDTCTYELDEALLEASNADGVLVRYVIRSN
jgi:hypothetical protein